VLKNHWGELDWQTPEIVRIKSRRSKRLSPYSDSDIWDLEELKTLVKYEPYLRNKAAIALMWDLNGRNHEITMLRIKHIRLKERYGEGEIPYQAKTGSGPILLTFSFPYVRDWINEHPFRNTPDARLICNLNNGAPINPEALWTMMKQLRSRISKLVETDSITDDAEREKLRLLLTTKKFNPY
jgi:integrase/recombinase XerD